MRRESTHSDGFHRRQIGIEVPLKKRLDLRQRTVFNHPVEPRIDATMKLGTLRLEHKTRRVVRNKRRRRGEPLPVAERASGRLQNFKRT